MEKFKIEMSKHRYKGVCNACPKKAGILFTLIVGDTRLIQLCGLCKGRLKRVINSK